MKKAIYVLPIILLIGLVSCKEEVSSSSSSNNPSISTSTTTSMVLDKDFYLGKLEEKASYYSISYSYTVKDSSNTTYKKGIKNKGVYITTEGTEAKIEHIFGSTTTRTSLLENNDTKTESFNYYFTPDTTYYLSDDNRYNLKEESHPDINAYSLAFDFTKAKSVSLEFENYDAILKGSVSKSDSSTFLEQTGVTISSDITFEATLSKDKGAFKTLKTNFIQSSYQIEYNYSFSSLMSVITLPTV